MILRYNLNKEKLTINHCFLAHSFRHHRRKTEKGGLQTSQVSLIKEIKMDLVLLKEQELINTLDYTKKENGMVLELSNIVMAQNLKVFLLTLKRKALGHTRELMEQNLEAIGMKINLFLLLKFVQKRNGNLQSSEMGQELSLTSGWHHLRHFFMAKFPLKHSFKIIKRLLLFLNIFKTIKNITLSSYLKKI